MDLKDLRYVHLFLVTALIPAQWVTVVHREVHLKLLCCFRYLVLAPCPLIPHTSSSLDVIFCWHAPMDSATTHEERAAARSFGSDKACVPFCSYFGFYIRLCCMQSLPFRLFLVSGRFTDAPSLVKVVGSSKLVDCCVDWALQLRAVRTSRRNLGDVIQQRDRCAANIKPPRWYTVAGWNF